MITYGIGSIFDSGAYALVNPVNCVGVMGKGLALEFKKRFPGNFKTYQSACSKGVVQIGKVFRYYTDLPGTPKIIFNFPTKQHWRDPSKLRYIEKGLLDLMLYISITDIPTIAIPALGCGEGGLDWNNDVYPRIASVAAVFPAITFLVYPPGVNL